MTDEKGEVKANHGSLNWPMVAMIIASGGINLLSTTQNGTQVREDQERAYRRVQQMHQAMDDFEKRQAKALENQNTIMKNDTELLNQIHAIVERLDRLKTFDQQRGAPQ